MSRISSLIRTQTAALLMAAGVASALAAPLPDWDGSLPTTGNPLTSQQYQDFTIYSLNYLTNLASKNTATTDPFYGLLKPISYDVDSSVGKLHDRLVVITGNTGAVDENSDVCGANKCDKAYPYPSPSDQFFTTSTTAEPSPAIPNEATRSTWTATRDALTAFLGGKDMVFMFNLNEDNGGDPNTLAGQSLLVSARVTLTDVDGNVLKTYYLGANNLLGLPTTAASEWAVKGEPEADPTNISPQAASAGSEGNELYDPMLAPGGDFSLDPRWAFVHGAISVDTTTGAFLGFGDCGFTGFANCSTINQNLGANQVAFSAFNQDLSDSLAISNVAFMNVDVYITGQSNGFEQLFIMAADIPEKVPEPGSLALVGLALAGGAISLRRRRHTQVNA